MSSIAKAATRFKSGTNSEQRAKSKRRGSKRVGRRHSSRRGSVFERLEAFKQKKTLQRKQTAFVLPDARGPSIMAAPSSSEDAPTTEGQEGDTVMSEAVAAGRESQRQRTQKIIRERQATATAAKSEGLQRETLSALAKEQAATAEADAFAAAAEVKPDTAATRSADSFVRRAGEVRATADADAFAAAAANS